MKKSQQLQLSTGMAFPARLSAMAIACQLLCLGVSAHAQTTTATSAAAPATVAATQVDSAGAATADASATVSGDNTAAPAAKSDADQAGTTQSNDANRVTITGKKVGNGLMVQEDIPKARSTITKEELLKQRPTGNAFQALDLLPAVNTYSYDATGLFGGGMSMRGFNSDQIGFTVNGVPVNDSGNFAVYPQEYVDLENTCSMYVTQGSTDVDSPHVGASGGNLGIVTCEPEKQGRVRFMQTVGELHLTKTYVRFDTGLVLDGRTRFFISASHAEVDKWKGLGEANRDHIDFGARWDYDKFNYVNFSFLYNKAVNNNIGNLSQAQIAQYGYYYDYSNTFVGHAPIIKGVQTDASQSPVFYKLSVNPFENVVTSATIALRFGESTDLKIVPYFWYGYGTGGNQQKTLTETNLTLPYSVKLGSFTGGIDLNDSGTINGSKIIVAGSSVTRTDRPGVTASLSHSFGDNQVVGGIWFERAEHKQTSPIVPVDNNGNAADIWMQNDLYLRPDGTPYEARDWVTISTAYQLFLQDTVHLMDDKLTINAGVRDPHIKRDFSNIANEGGTNQLFWTNYEIDKTYDTLLPQIGLKYQLNNNDQVFTSLAKNMKAPPNYAFSPAQSGANVGFIGGTNVTASNGQIINTGGTVGIISNVQPETSYNLDLGFRHQTDLLTFQASVYAVDFKNRMATAVDPNTLTSTYTNAGSVRAHGIELELGTTPVNGWSYYGSVSNNYSKLQDNLVVGGTIAAHGTTPSQTANVTLPTAGNEFPDSPKWKIGLSAQYETGNWYVRLKAKHTSDQQSTIMNDELTPDYNVMDLDGGYQFASSHFFKKPTLRLNVSNLGNMRYINSSSQSVTNAKTYSSYVNTPTGKQLATVSPTTVYYYEGQPRFVSLTLSADF